MRLRTGQEEVAMKVLKIEKFQGYYSVTEDKFSSIDEIDKDDLLKLVDIALTDDFEIDSYDVETLKNKAHQIIYKSISEKLLDLHKRKNEFRDESERLFLEEYEKYKPNS